MRAAHKTRCSTRNQREEAIVEIGQNQRRRVVATSIDVYISLLVITIFVYLSFRFFAPLVMILIWAAVLAVALFPIYEGLKSKLGALSRFASALIALIALALLLTPTVLAVDSMIDSIINVAGKINRGELVVPAPAESVKAWPLIGEWMFNSWSKAHANLRGMIGEFGPQVKDATAMLLRTSASLTVGVLQFAFAIILAAIFMSFSDPLVSSTTTVARRVGPKRGEQMVLMAGATIRNVSRGVLGVAVLQGALATVGLVVYGMPFAGILGAAALMLCIVQAPPLAFIPIITYAWVLDSGVTTVIFAAYVIAVMFLDNVLKPMLMARGLTTPMVVILIGVIGGTLNAGMVGIFIGPVVLALTYEMLMIWLSDVERDPAGDVTETDGPAEGGA